MDISSWAQILARAFPRLSREGYEIKSEPTEQYNCIAYAAADTSKWWSDIRGRYWPDFATRSESMGSLIEVFAGIGYQRCQDSRLESGYEKVALYEEDGKWMHAAVQMPSGRWCSKVGAGPLIEHRSPESLSGGEYGEPTVHMRRPVPLKAGTA